MVAPDATIVHIKDKLHIMTPKTVRADALRNLVKLREPVSDALARLSSFDWSSDVELVVVTTSHLACALDGFDDGSLDGTALSAWAESLQGREDITLDPVARDMLAEALFELSTPELFGSIEEVVASARARLD